MKLEWRKHEKALYGAKSSPALVQIPRQNFIMLQGSGNPNGADFSERVSALFSLAYAVKMDYKAAAKNSPPDAVQDFAVYPLEGVWGQKGAEAQAAGALVKENLEYTIMIRQPDFITAEAVRAALEKVKRKKPNRLYEEIFFDTMQDGKCVELLHIGPYDAEPSSFARMDQFARENGLARASDRHREIYLTNRSKPEMLKTILRYPVR